MKNLYKFPCTHEGCPVSCVNGPARDAHAQKPHHRCPDCGRYFVSLPKHLSQNRRKGGPCGRIDGAAGLTNIDTWDDLLKALKRLTPTQLKQKAQIVPNQPDQTKSQELWPTVALGTVKAMGYESSRSSYDNAHHPGDVVLLTDWNMFAEDGAIAEDLHTGERIYPKKKANKGADAN